MAEDNPNPETGEVNLFSSEFAAHPQPVYQQMHERCPVARAAITGSPVLTRYEDVIWALRHPEIFSSEMEMQLALGTQRPMIPQQIDPPEQTRFRRILDPRFSRRRVKEIEPDVRRHANALIDKIVDLGECEFDSAFAIPLPCTVFLSLLGLPQEDLDLFLELKDGIIRPKTTSADPEEAAKLRAATGSQIYSYFERVIDERKASPREDTMTYLVNAEIEGKKLTRNEILDICFLMLLGGLDTVTATLGCNIAFLASNPEHRRRIVDDPKLIANAIEEMLRFETPVTGVPRIAKQNVTVGGFEIKEGEMVMLLLGAADIDKDAFRGADRVDFDRERNRHVAFGAGPHRCLGSHLARMELTVAMEEWHRRIPDYAIKPGESPRVSPGIREVQYLPIVWEVR
ncbi:MAG: cytochrome P450 [Myxococcota bacterium]